MMEFDEALQDIFYTPRILGNFPFDGNFRISKKLLCYCCLLRFISVFGVIAPFIYNPSTFTKEVVICSISFAMKYTAITSVLGDNFFSLLWWFLKRHRLSFLVESINEMQSRKKIALGRKYIRFIHCFLLISFVANVFFYWVFIDKENATDDIISELSYYLSTSSKMCFVGQFWDILHLLGHLLRESTQLYDESSAMSYERFLTLCGAVNEIYGSQALFTITQYFIHTIFYLYMLLLPMFPGFHIQNVLIMVQLINCIIPILSLILACNYYMKQERNFNDDLKRRMIEEKSRVLLKNEKLNFHFVVGQETTFTACGFFNIDMSLICSMTSAATTYLVIVLQYNSGNHPISNSTSSSDV